MITYGSNLPAFVAIGATLVVGFLLAIALFVTKKPSGPTEDKRKFKK